jgi:methionine transaminase
MTVRTPHIQTKLPAVGTTIFTVMSALATEHKAVNLGQGFPDFDCDPKLVEAVNGMLLLQKLKHCMAKNTMLVLK